MPNHYNVCEFINLFKDAFKTVDLRAALLKQDNQWQILSIALRIRIASEELVRQEFRGLESRYGRIDSDEIRIIQTCFPLCDLHYLTEGFSNGEIVVDGLTLKVKPVENILELNGNFNSFRKSEKKKSVLDWPVLLSSVALASSNDYYTLLQSDPRIVRKVEKAGHHDSFDAIKKLLSVDYNSSSINLFIEVEVPTRINSIKTKLIGSGL